MNLAVKLHVVNIHPGIFCRGYTIVVEKFHKNGEEGSKNSLSDGKGTTRGVVRRTNLSKTTSMESAEWLVIVVATYSDWSTTGRGV